MCIRCAVGIESHGAGLIREETALPSDPAVDWIGARAISPKAWRLAASGGDPRWSQRTIGKYISGFHTACQRRIDQSSVIAGGRSVCATERGQVRRELIGVR